MRGCRSFSLDTRPTESPERCLLSIIPLRSSRDETLPVLLSRHKADRKSGEMSTEHHPPISSRDETLPILLSRHKTDTTLLPSLKHTSLA
jgi:hypothetical protein